MGTPLSPVFVAASAAVCAAAGVAVKLYDEVADAQLELPSGGVAALHATQLATAVAFAALSPLHLLLTGVTAAALLAYDAVARLVGLRPSLDTPFYAAFSIAAVAAAGAGFATGRVGWHLMSPGRAYLLLIGGAVLWGYVDNAAFPEEYSAGKAAYRAGTLTAAVLALGTPVLPPELEPLLLFPIAYLVTWFVVKLRHSSRAAPAGEEEESGRQL